MSFIILLETMMTRQEEKLLKGKVDKELILRYFFSFFLNKLLYLC
jgi:hypothetical protein